MTKRYIVERKQDYYIKSQSWFNNEEVQLTIYEYISSFKNKLSVQKLAKVVKSYLSL